MPTICHATGRCERVQSRPETVIITLDRGCIVRVRARAPVRMRIPSSAGSSAKQMDFFFHLPGSGRADKSESEKNTKKKKRETSFPLCDRVPTTVRRAYNVIVCRTNRFRRSGRPGTDLRSGRVIRKIQDEPLHGALRPLGDDRNNRVSQLAQ